MDELVHIKGARWRPDTCGCIIEYEYDDDLPANTREQTHVGKTIIHKCNKHVSVPNDAVILFETLDEETKRKDFVFGLAQEVIPAIKFEDYLWAFEADRKLTVSFRGLNPSAVLAIKGNVASKIDNLLSAYFAAFGRKHVTSAGEIDVG